MDLRRAFVFTEDILTFQGRITQAITSTVARLRSSVFVSRSGTGIKVGTDPEMLLGIDLSTFRKLFGSRCWEYSDSSPGLGGELL